MSMQNPVFIPGPTNIPEALRKACDMPTIDHRSPLFGEILHPARAAVRRILKSDSAEIFIFPSTGTGGWETAISNTLSPGDKVLVARNGMFSHKWIDMCQRHGLDLTIVDVPWGEGLPADRFEEILTADSGHEIKVVLATHNETATGVKSDIAAVRAAIDAAGHPAMLFVDGVSSIGSMDFRFDEWGVDVAVTGSQKGFMLPAGLAIVGFSERAMAATPTAKLHRTFFDIRDMEKGYAASAYPYTPAVGLMNGLNEACKMLEAEGLENVFARHHLMAEGVRAAVRAWGLELCAGRPELYSDTVSAIRTPEGFNASDIVSHAMHGYGVAFGTGLGEVAGKVFRIGHLGSLTPTMALSGIATAEMCMKDLGIELDLGSGVAAAQDVYRSGKKTTVKEAA
ncbi:aminotransferase class V-fold PLP-dependent enzyme [Alphaproteobacteria bacterium GH1-50]|uniref:Aminotransferase class V-fold PLP-dependent enzyme n=1 Tax=Kangsaoukella pontilimi TaxID=2691042 RepID=A0A7C9IFR9_9RHOB|nr:L-aspartate--glyoxylate aminotransferase BhcA [Kangsaoukella pontilimi]MXQ07489.1 aminotransferase class V-fold PLP-dependent enzyme [Kangsaoukella pontilimi]